MHLCPDEVNALVSSLPFLEHLARYAKVGLRWVIAKVKP